MKKLLMLIVCGASTVMVFAQQYPSTRRYPPTAVERSWQRDYPTVTYNTNDEPWEWRNNRWHRRFRDRNNDGYVDVYYDRNGRRIYSMNEYDRNSLPLRVRERIRNRYRTDQYNVYRIQRPGRGLYFQITLGNNRQIYLDERGREVRHYY